MRSPVFFVVVTAVAVVVTACAGLQTGGPLAAPGAGSWVEVTTPHFVVRTDLPEAAARDRAIALEEIDNALLDLAFKSADPPADKVEVVIFNDRSAFADATRAKWVGGFTVSDADLDEHVRIVIPASGPRSERRILQHELTHRFVHYFMPGAPIWLNEGMAAFYETMSLGAGDATIGESPFLFARAGSGHRGGAIPMDDLPAATAVASFAPRQFYAKDGYAAEVNYAAAWLLVSMLVTGSPADREHFWAYVAALSHGTPAKDAWAAQLASLPLDDEAAAYRKHGVIGVARVPYRRRAVDVAQITARPMRSEEARVLVATLTRNQDLAKKLMAAALREAPQSAEVHYQAGLLRARTGQRGAEGELQKALTLAPDEPRYVVALASIHYELQAAKPPEKRDLAAIAPEMRALAALGDNFHAQNTAAWYFADTGDVDAGLPLAHRAVEIAPACWECIDTLARLVSMKGDVRQAAAIERRAVAAYPGERPPEELLDALTKYEAAAAAAP